MTLAQLKASRALWLTRERYRFNRWHHYRFDSKRADAERKALRMKWWRLYSEAHARRMRREDQIATARQPSTVSQAGVELIARFEGFVGHPYRDAVGVWTIGYGHTGPDVRTMGTITEPEARALLRHDLDAKYVPPVRKLSKTVPLNQRQFDALVSFVYNLGPGYLEPGHTMGDALHARDYKAAADAFLLYDKAGGHPLPGLTRRRKAERQLFLS